MTTKVEFHFDFGSPNAYFVHRLIPEIELRTGATFDYVPVLLGGVFKATGNQAPMLAFAGIPSKLAYQSLEIRRFIAKHDLTAFTMNTHFPVNTLQIMRGAVAAEELGVAPSYIEAVFAAMWEKSLKMDDPAVIATTLKDAGLDADALIARSQSPEVKAKLAANTEASVKRGTFGIPTMFIGDEIWFGKDTLRDVEDAIVHAQQDDAAHEPVREFP
ncbi:2-hydroxychromene-2-carboxylate isomerase [Alphaproteobacteria bacterium SO-S41]|nr:2-hydroxychromene-2-carboxylate isomerase [Alphaproteobacteria bacterium SO-S41]